MTIGIMGAGAFGTALAIALSANGTPVRLWARDPAQITEMQKRRENLRHLPGLPLPESITPCVDAAALTDCEVILLSVPMQQIRNALEQHRAALAEAPLIACCKGIERGTLLTPVELLDNLRPGGVHGLLTGPSFARDIAEGLPTALTLACTDSALAERLQPLLSRPALRLYRSTDTLGAGLGGALKNVVAIGAGAVMGAGLGDSARAALMTRGFAEIARLSARLGARTETLMGLSGFGDLVLTCTSAGSRNYRLGETLGRGAVFDPAITVEGVATAEAVADLAARRDLDLPVMRAIHGLASHGLTVEAAMEILLSRPLKAE